MNPTLYPQSKADDFNGKDMFTEGAGTLIYVQYWKRPCIGEEVESWDNKAFAGETKVQKDMRRLRATEDMMDDQERWRHVECCW